jgi:hypothetical protein
MNPAFRWRVELRHSVRVNPFCVPGKFPFLQPDGGYDCGMNEGKTMNCPACGNTVAETDQFCSKCFARLEPPGLWRKFLSVFQAVNKPQRRILKIKTTATIKTTDKDGQRHEYHSLDEAPPELRADIEKLESEALKGNVTPGMISRKSVSLFKVKDASGNERIYHSLDEMPPDIRALVENFQRKGGSQ